MGKDSTRITYSENIKNVRISENTMALLLCQAKLNEILDVISEMIDKDYDKDIDDLFNGFTDKFHAFDDALTEVTNHYIKKAVLESRFAEI